MAEKGLNDLRETIQRIAEGDEAAFMHLYRRYSPSIHSYASRIARSETSADEILQETFVRIWLSRDKLPEVQNLQAWIYTIAANECMRFLRQQLTYEKKLQEEQQRKLVLNESPASPESYALSNQIKQLVQEAVATLPPQKRLIYQLSREEGLKPSAIAEKLSLSVGTVKNVLSLALKDIRLYLVQGGVSFTLCSCRDFIFF